MWEHIHTGSHAYAWMIPAIFVGIKCKKDGQVGDPRILQEQVRTHVALHRDGMNDNLSYACNQ